MELKIYVLLDKVGEWFDIRLTFTSNINMAETTIRKVVPKEYAKDIRRRIIKDMFYELHEQVLEREDAFQELLEQYRGC